MKSNGGYSPEKEAKLQKLIDENTTVRPLVDEDGTKGFAVFMKIDHQQFQLTPYVCEDEDCVKFWQRSIAIALLRFRETNEKTITK